MDVRCETCYFFKSHPRYAGVGHCQHPLPPLPAAVRVIVDNIVHADEGASCKTWTLKTLTN